MKADKVNFTGKYTWLCNLRSPKIPSDLYNYFKKGGNADEFVSKLLSENMDVIALPTINESVLCNLKLDDEMTLSIILDKDIEKTEKRFKLITRLTDILIKKYKPLINNEKDIDVGDYIKPELKELIRKSKDLFTVY